MGEQTRPGAGLRALLGVAATVVVIAGLKASSSVLIPILASAMIAVLCMPAILWLQRRRLPEWAAVTTVFLVVLVAVVGFSTLVGSSVADFNAEVREPTSDLNERLEGLREETTLWLASKNIDVSAELHDAFDPRGVLSAVGTAAGAIADLLSNTLFVLLTVAFMLGEAAGFPRKLREAFGNRTASDGHDEMVESVRSYVRIKTEVSLATGALAALTCAMGDVRYAILWGVAAFLLNFVPTVGSLVAAVPPILLALVEHGWQTAVAIAITYTAINLVIGNVIEPRLMGRRLGLSSLVVWLSLVFWGWVWGPVGMLLSVPLTMMVKLLFEHSDDLRWVGVLLGPGGEGLSAKAKAAAVADDAADDAANSASPSASHDDTPAAPRGTP